MFESMDLSSLLPTRYSSNAAGGGEYSQLSDGSTPILSNTTANDDDEGWFPSLTWRERLLGCSTCMIGGYILSFGSLFRLKSLVLGNPSECCMLLFSFEWPIMYSQILYSIVPYVINATVGNIIALCGSCFLSGPTSQSRKMFHPTRRIATIVYLSSMILTLLIALIPFPGSKAPVLLVLMLCQYISITWYCLSYIPFARDVILGWLNRFINRDEY